MSHLDRAPTPDQFDLMIGNLDKILNEYEYALKTKALNMEICGVDNTCGSPMCHGGWYGAINNLSDYNEGADLMAQHLGFSYGYELEQWASVNRHKWGGPYGRDMFCSNDAFNETDESITLEKIRNWWAGVRNRCHPDLEPMGDFVRGGV